MAHRSFSPSKWIVDPLPGVGTHTTLTSALSSAVSGDTIFMHPGTYTEDPTLKAGVNICAYNCDAQTPNVIIKGKCTATFAGTCTLSGINFQTNSDFSLAVTGSSATIVNLFNCYINCLNNTGISFTSSSSSSKINLYYCNGNIATTGITLITASSAGSYNAYSSYITNTGLSTTASSSSATQMSNFYCKMDFPLSSTLTGSWNGDNSVFSTVNTTGYTLTGTVSPGFKKCIFGSGTASCISVGAGCSVDLDNCSFSSTNTNVVTGAGSIRYQLPEFFGASASTNFNVTTQTGGTVQGGTFQAPSAGFLGETLLSNIAAGSHVALSNGSATTITSINLTPGNWIVLGNIEITGITTGTVLIGAINTTTNNIGNPATDYSIISWSTNTDQTITPPIHYATVTTTTTYYLVGRADYTVGSAFGFGFIRAVRIG
ncbi:MAG: hypothetical protein ABFD00_10570 [Chloroherpetonaceae bacterium]